MIIWKPDKKKTNRTHRTDRRTDGGSTLNAPHNMQISQILTDTLTANILLLVLL